MPLIAPVIKAKFKDTIYSGLKREFSGAAGKGKDYPPIADEFWEKLASAISDIATDMVTEITTNAMVMPGIPTMTLGILPGVSAGPGMIK